VLAGALLLVLLVEVEDVLLEAVLPPASEPVLLLSFFVEL
jgi:hypothetical protein